MPVMQFKKQFVPLIQAKQKTMTIRPLNKGRYEVGGTLYFMNGYRAGSRFGTALIKSVQKNVYFSRDGYSLIADNAPADATIIEHSQWVKQCGFDDYHQAFEWYEKQGYPVATMLQIISWGGTFYGSK